MTDDAVKAAAEAIHQATGCVFTPGSTCSHLDEARVAVEAARPHIEHTSPYADAFWRTQKVLDRALGTDAEDGAGEGMAEDVALVVEMRDAARAEVARYRAALERITRDEGLVCSEYDICTHGSCMSSYSSWAIARAALDGDQR